MNAELLQSHWALVLASFTGVVLLIVAARYFLRTSARGQLRRTRRALDRERGRLRKALAVVDRAERRKSRFARNVDRVKPRLLQEANEALADAKSLAAIARDRMLVAENHLRRVILEEFPPSQHDRLRARYLPQATRDKKPFTF